MSQGVQGCPSPGMAERGEGSGGCNRGDGLPPGTGNGGCNRSDGLPPVPRTPSQQGSGSGMDGQTPEVVCFSLLFYIAIPIPEVIQCYHLFVHLPIVHELSSCPPAVLFLVLVSGCVVCLLVFLFCFVFGFWCLFFVLHGDSQWIMYRSNSVLFCITLSL